MKAAKINFKMPAQRKRQERLA